METFHNLKTRQDRQDGHHSSALGVLVIHILHCEPHWILQSRDLTVNVLIQLC